VVHRMLTVLASTGFPYCASKLPYPSTFNSYILSL
jgi:hypothetical protein